MGTARRDLRDVRVLRQLCVGAVSLVVGAASLPLADASPGASPVSPGRTAAAGAGSGLVRVATFPRRADDRPLVDRGGTDLAFDGRYVYAAEQGRDPASGGLQVIDTRGRLPRVVATLRCGGWQNDVALVRKGLVALGYHSGSGSCGSAAGGITLVDVSVPTRPRVLGSTREPVGASDLPDGLSGVHTITPLPGTALVYASPGGRQSLSAGRETVIDTTDPRRPVVAGSFETTIGCHDLVFDVRPGRRLGFCSGVGETQVWDMTTPLAPSVLARVVNPLHPFQHSAVVSSDGKALVIGTETLANECAGGPTGALVAYDITDPRLPVLSGWYGAQRGAAPVYTAVTDPAFDQLCAPHQFNLLPGTRTVVSGNGSGGVNVVDLGNPRAPKELGWFSASDRDYFAAYWFGGRIYANAVQAVDVFELRSTGGAATARRARGGPVGRSLSQVLTSSDGATRCFA